MPVRMVTNLFSVSCYPRNKVNFPNTNIPLQSHIEPRKALSELESLCADGRRRFGELVREPNCAYTNAFGGQLVLEDS